MHHGVTKIAYQYIVHCDCAKQQLGFTETFARTSAELSNCWGLEPSYGDAMKQAVYGESWSND